jgi:alpha-tubulin suppressor-like RCC1 family protein
MPPQAVNLGGARAVQIATGFEHTCILTATGGVRCWGSNGFNQLGYGSSPPSSPPHSADIQFDSPNPKAVQVACGYYHSCVLLEDGRVSCFGWNIDFQIGSSNTGETNSPPSNQKIYIQMPNNDKVKQICVGWDHSCALTLQGEVACWGYNFRG